MDLRKLEIFEAVIATGSFSAAAERLYLTQSAVSQHIHELEASLGVELFKRGRRGVQLTTAGATLADYTQSILRLVNEAKRAITNVENLQSGQLRVGATPGVGDYLLPEWLQPFRERHPHLTIALHTDITDAVLRQLLDQQLDIAFVEGELGSHPHIEHLILAEVPQKVVVGKNHAWFGHEQVSLAMLENQPLVMRHARSHTRRWVDEMFHQQGIKPQVVAEFDSPEAIKQAVKSGMGISILPDYVMRQEIELGLLHALTLKDVLLERTLKLVWDKRESFSPMTRAFLSQLQSLFPQILLID